MSPNSTDFSLQSLEARFEMQCMDNHDTGGYYLQQELTADDCGGGGGGGYGYYGNSWDNLGNGDAYVGPYQVASDESGAMLDDGSYTDGSSGAFPAYNNPDVCRLDPTFPGCPPQQQTSRCTICRC